MHSPALTLSLTESASWTLAAARHHERAPTAAIPADVPGCVHTDLLRAGVIADPFIDDNELAAEWVADVDWVFTTSFRISSPMLEHHRITLVFEGLDTLATVEVNGSVVATTANMHRSYRFEIKHLVHEGVNQLAVTFASATRHAEQLRSEAPPWPSSSFDRPYNYIRKMACSWGWDWGPWLTSAGIWKAARIECWTGARFAAVRPTATVDALDHGTVSADITCECTDTQPSMASFAHLQLWDPSGQPCAAAHAPLEGGSDRVTIVLAAGPVERWWPHTHGPQPLYRLDATLVDADGSTLHTWSRRIGFRSIRLDTTPDATGSAFTFVVNDLAVFARGVNWIPEDTFPARVTETQVRQRLGQAKAANVDLVRVWGGGLYESDTFYDICDELGLMVWQDFCFACAAYPEPLLAEEVEAEARENVERLMPHPSLVVWNGNNENIWGWFDWGWQQRLDGRPWGAGFYFDLLPKVVAEIDPSRPYWPGSPFSGSMAVAANADAHGCTHVWDVWNQLDFSRYRDHAPRFVAEFGWQAPPTWNTLRNAVHDDPLSADSPGMLRHQKADDGNAKLSRGLSAHVGVPADFESWWWATQLLQARAVTTGVEHFRSLRGHCMGTIWWQLNDCWPSTSWALVDAGGQPKPAWFALRDAYRPRLLTVQPRGDRLALFAVNDSHEPWSVLGSMRRIDFRGVVLAEEHIAIDVPAGSIGSIPIARAIAESSRPAAELVVVDAGGERALWWYRPDKDLALEQPRLTIGSTVCGCGDRSITLLAHNLVRDLTIMPDRVAPGAECDRQLITLLPNETATVTVRGGDGLTATQLTQAPAMWSAYSAVAAARLASAE